MADCGSVVDFLDVETQKSSAPTLPKRMIAADADGADLSRLDNLNAD
jgi:hypothetical protein